MKFKLCRDCPAGDYWTTVWVDINRTNLCQYLWGFLKGWWRNEKELKLVVRHVNPPQLFSNGVQVWPPLPDTSSCSEAKVNK